MYIILSISAQENVTKNVKPDKESIRPNKNTRKKHLQETKMSTKYQDSMNILETVQNRTTTIHQSPTMGERQLIKALTENGYIEKTGIRKNTQNSISLTEKGVKTLQEYNKIRKILEKIREGTHPSMDHPDR
jgi:hypothetical protein